MISRYRLFYLIILFLALQVILTNSANAEYRVYRLGVTYSPSQGEVEVITTLDDLQYNTYYKVTSDQQVRLIDHWMCWGRTDDFTPYCDKPVAPPARAPVTNQEVSQANGHSQDRSPAELPVPSKN